MKKSLNKELGSLCMLCHEISATTECDVFFRYSPHVNFLDITVYENGWEEGQEQLCLTNIVGNEITLKNISKTKAMLQKYRGEK